MREFDTAVKVVEDEDAPRDEGSLPAGTIQLKINEKDGEEILHTQVCTFFLPNDGQAAMFLATTGRHTNSTDKVAGIINFLTEICDDETHTYLADRLYDREDPFGLDEITDIIDSLVEDWSGRDPGSPSASVNSRRSAGRRSTRATPALT